MRRIEKQQGEGKERGGEEEEVRVWRNKPNAASSQKFNCNWQLREFSSGLISVPELSSQV